MSRPRFMKKAGKTSGHFMTMGYTRGGKIFPVELSDFICLGAARCDDLDGAALLLAVQRARERRGDRDAALLGVGLGFTDDLIDHLLLGVLVDLRLGRAEHVGVARQFCVVVVV